MYSDERLSRIRRAVSQGAVCRGLVAEGIVDAEGETEIDPHEALGCLSMVVQNLVDTVLALRHKKVTSE